MENIHMDNNLSNFNVNDYEFDEYVGLLLIYSTSSD